MITAISESRIFQKIGLDINREADFAPKPIEYLGNGSFLNQNQKIT